MNKVEVLKMQIERALFTPYIWGGNHINTGVDCSGFVLELLRSVGLWTKSDATAADIYNTFYPITAANMSVQSFGDLVFFGKERIIHVGMVLCQGIMVEAGGGGSNTKTIEDARKAGAYVRIRPLNFRNDLFSVLSVSALF